jgi:hypothetical protein
MTSSLPSLKELAERCVNQSARECFQILAGGGLSFDSRVIHTEAWSKWSRIFEYWWKGDENITLLFSPDSFRCVAAFYGTREQDR